MHDRCWLEERIKALCRDIGESILAQAAAYEQEVLATGEWKVLPPRWRNPEALGQIAHRLYLRVVKRLSWNQVAATTGVDAGLARRQARYAVALLEIRPQS